MLGNVLFALAATITAVLHYAVVRSPRITDSTVVGGIRRVKIVAYGLISLRAWWLIAMSGNVLIPIDLMFPLLLLVFADLFSALYPLFQQEFDELAHTHDAKCRHKRAKHVP